MSICLHVSVHYVHAWWAQHSEEGTWSLRVTNGWSYNVDVLPIEARSSARATSAWTTETVKFFLKVSELCSPAVPHAGTPFQGYEIQHTYQPNLKAQLLSISKNWKR